MFESFRELLRFCSLHCGVKFKYFLNAYRFPQRKLRYRLLRRELTAENIAVTVTASKGGGMRVPLTILVRLKNCGTQPMLKNVESTKSKDFSGECKLRGKIKRNEVL